MEFYFAAASSIVVCFSHLTLRTALVLVRTLMVQKQKENVNVFFLQYKLKLKSHTTSNRLCFAALTKVVMAPLYTLGLFKENYKVYLAIYNLIKSKWDMNAIDCTWNHVYKTRALHFIRSVSSSNTFSVLGLIL